MVRSIAQRHAKKEINWKTQISNKVREYELPGKTAGVWIEFLTGKMGRKHRLALKKDVTKTLIDMLEESIINETNIIGLINGPPFSGKSRMARTLMKIIENKANKSRKIKYPIEFSFYKTILQKKLKEMQPPGGIIQDEIPREHGKDSNIKKDAVGNLTDSIRQTQISLMFCTPIKDSDTFLNYKLLMFGTNKKENKLRAWMYQYIEMIPILIGIVELDFINDEKLEAIYKPLKEDYLLKMRKHGGHVDTILDKEEIEMSIQKYFDILKNNYNMKAVKKYLGSPRKLMSFLEQKHDLEGSENFKSQIINGILAKLYEAELLKKEDSELLSDQEEIPSVTQNNREIISEKMELDPRIRQYQTIFIEMLYQKLWKYPIKPPKRIKIKVFELKCMKENNLSIHRKLKIATGTVSNYFNEILEEVVGYAGEDVFEDILKELGLDYERGGLNSPDPDFIIHALRLIVSFKTFYIYRKHKALKNIAESEFKASEKLGYDLISLGYDCDKALFQCFLVKFQSSIKSDAKSTFPEDPLNTPSFLRVWSGEGVDASEGIAGDGGTGDGEKGGGVQEKTKKNRRGRRKKKRSKSPKLENYLDIKSLEEIWSDLLQG